MTFIRLPDRPMPNDMDVLLMDMGGVLRGASSLRIDRPGNRHAITFKYPREAMAPEVASGFKARLKRAKRQGIEVKIPLLVPQGLPGAPVVDGAVTSSASSLAVRGLNPGYAALEDFWLTIIEADGTAYLHSISVTAVAGADGKAVWQIEPPLRAPFADGDTIEIGAPYIQGFVANEMGFRTDPERITDVMVSVEEYQ